MSTKTVDEHGVDLGLTIRSMLRRAFKAALATRDRETGAPYASLVQVATTLDACPIVLVSGLAVHTRNITADPLASLLIDESDAFGDPAQGARVTLSGRFTANVTVDARARYFARHRGAERFAGFSDSRFLILELTSAHLIQGFGRITTLAGSNVILPLDLNAASRTAWVDATATLRSRFPTVTGLDTEGVDVVENTRGVRHLFPEPARNPAFALAQATALLQASRD